MTTDYPDWNFPNWLVDQSPALYVADVLTKLLENFVITEKKLLKEGAVLYCWDSVIIKDEGILLNMGTLRIFKD